MADVTDAEFETAVLERSTQVPVVVDLWAEWCGPCRTLGPILERVIAETDGRVELAKVDVDANPQVAGAFRVQSIPAVYGIRDRQVVDHFLGAQPEQQVRAFVERLAPNVSEADRLAESGSPEDLRRALELEPAHPAAVVRLAEHLVRSGTEEATREALALLERIPESAETKRISALARTGGKVPTADEIISSLDDLLTRVKGDDAVRQEFLDRLELLANDDPRKLEYRRKLTAQLF